MRKRCAAAAMLVGAALAIGGCAESSAPRTALPNPTASAAAEVSPSPSASPSATATVAFCQSVGAVLGQSALPAALLELQRSGVEALDGLTQAAEDTAGALAGIDRETGMDPNVDARATDLRNALTAMADLGADDTEDTLTTRAVALTRLIGAFTDACATP